MTLNKCRAGNSKNHMGQYASSTWLYISNLILNKHMMKLTILFFLLFGLITYLIHGVENQDVDICKY